MIFVLILPILFIALGIYFIVKSKKESANRGFYQWIGISLIVMTLFFVLLGSYQIIAPEEHVGH